MRLRLPARPARPTPSQGPPLVGLHMITGVRQGDEAGMGGGGVVSRCVVGLASGRVRAPWGWRFPRRMPLRRGPNSRRRWYLRLLVQGQRWASDIRKSMLTVHGEGLPGPAAPSCPRTMTGPACAATVQDRFIPRRTVGGEELRGCGAPGGRGLRSTTARPTSLTARTCPNHRHFNAAPRVTNKGRSAQHCCP